MTTYYVIIHWIDGRTSNGSANNPHDAADLNRCISHANNRLRNNKRISKIKIVEAQGRKWGPLVRLITR